MTFYLSHLSENHQRSHIEGSGISLEIAAERGYRTAHGRSELPEAFKSYQRRAPALVVPMYSPDGKTTGHQIRPDNPRKDRRSKR